MTVQFAQDIVDSIRAFAALVNSTEGIPRSFNRQCWNPESLAVGRDGGNPRGDAKADIAELAQFFYHSVDLLGIHPLGIEDRLRVVEYYEDLGGG